MSETLAPPAAAAPAAAPSAASGGDPQGRAAPAAGAPPASSGAAPGAAAVAPPAAPSTLLGDAPPAPDQRSVGVSQADPNARETKVDAPVEGEAKADAPIGYEEFALPDGIAKDSPLLVTFSAEAAKLGIPQDQAQALVTAVGEKLATDAKASAEAQAGAQMSAWVQTNEAWQAEIKADPEIGGARFEPMKVNVARLFDDYVGPLNSPERKALNEALLHTGAGNNPAIVRAFAKIAAAHTEGGFVGGSPGRGPVDRAALLYPTMANGGARPQRS